MYTKQEVIDLVEKLTGSTDAYNALSACYVELLDSHVQKCDEYAQLSNSYNELAQRLKHIIKRNMRMTRLLRNALPEAQQVGCGLEGMIQSLLAALVGKQNYEVLDETGSVHNRVDPRHEPDECDTDRSCSCSEE